MSTSGSPRASGSPSPSTRIPPFPELPNSKHPWDVICDAYFSADPLAGESAILHNAHLGNEEPRTLNIPPQYDTTEVQGAEWYREGVQIEVSHHYTILPYLLAVDPAVTDKSYHGIMALVYKTWMRRLIKFRTTLDMTPDNLKNLTDAQIEAESSKGKPIDHLTKLGDILLTEFDAGSPTFKAADKVTRLKRHTLNMLAVLKRWTDEWEEERKELEEQHLPFI